MKYKGYHIKKRDKGILYNGTWWYYTLELNGEICGYFMTLGEAKKFCQKMEKEHD
jgi:hypothetical protein